RSASMELSFSEPMYYFPHQVPRNTQSLAEHQKRVHSEPPTLSATAPASLGCRERLLHDFARVINKPLADSRIRRSFFETHLKKSISINTLWHSRRTHTARKPHPERPLVTPLPLRTNARTCS